MKKSIFLFFAAILCSLSAGAATERVYFVNASNWSKINVHAWDGTATGTSWPGNTATKDTWQWEGKDVYYFEAEAGAYKKCIFNNGNGQQTADLPWTANQVYDHNSQSWLPVEVAQATTTGTTVYFVNTENWNPVNVYAFSKYPSEINNSWPGVAATKESYQIGGFDVYSYKITKEFDYCIFNNGSQQSADLPWYQGKYYAPSKNTWYDDKAAAEEALAVPVDDVTVHFINTPKWAAVACHHWVEGGSGTSWPGEVLSKTDEIAGYDVYTATFTGEHTSCIFNNNNNGSQTGDLTVKDGQYYALSTDEWYADKAAAEAALATPLPDETIYFVNNKEWTTINVYAWGGSISDLNSWPGKPNMTKETEQIAGFDVYSLTAQKGSYKNFIINNGSSQSADFTWNDDKYYWIEGTATGDTKANAEAALAAPVVTYDYYVIGTINNWGLKDAAYGMTDDDADGVYEKVITLADGKNQLKINKGEWKDGEIWGYDQLAVEYEGVSRGANSDDNNIIIDITPGKDITVKFDKNTSKITLDGLTEKAPVVLGHDYYITGSFNENNPADEDHGMTLDGTVYKATVTLAADDNMLKVTDGTWNNTWGYNELGANYEEVSNPNDYNNIKITLAEEKEITVIFDATAGKITFEGLTEKVIEYGVTFNVTVPEGTEACYICGAWDWNTFKPMTKVDDTHYTLEIAEATKDHGYKYTCGEGWEFVEKDAEGNDLAGDRTWSDNDVVAAWPAPAEPVEMASVVLLGVEGDWTDGIEMELNPYDANEYMLLCQSITADEPIKIKAVDTQSTLTWCAQLAETSLGTVVKDADGNDNIVLEEGKYDFYYKVAENEVWIGTCTETEPEYMVVEEEITNFVFDMEAWPMVCMGGPSTNSQIEVYLVLTEAADGTLAYEDCSVSIMGTDATFIDGTLSNIDPYAPYADAVLHVQWNEEYYELQLAMSSTPAEPITIEAEDATVTLTEYPANFEATEFAYELAMVANWVNEAESLPYTVEFVIPTFDPTKASGEYNANFWVTGDGNAFGMGQDVLVTVTKDGNNVTLTGNVSAFNDNAYNVTISGTIPDYTRTVALNQWGTICLPKASSSFTGATFYEVSSLDPAKGLWLDQLAAGAQLEAGKPYIFQATATEIAVVYTGAAKSAPVAGENGLTGTFTDIAAGGVLVDNYIIANNAVWVANENNDLPANRAYINAALVPTETQAEIPGRRRVCMGENATTGLDQIVAPAGQAVKAIENGQLIIIRDGVKYNVQGQVIR